MMESIPKETLSLELKVKLWERAIETQMHFAELSIKMRQLGLTLAGGTIALAIVLLRTSADFPIAVPILQTSLPVSSILCVGAAVTLFGASIIDVGVYHRMLRGAVRFNELLEEDLDREVGWRSGLTEAISAFSRYKEPKRNPLPQRNERGTHWENSSEWKINAGVRITVFYVLGIIALLLSAFAIGWAHINGLPAGL